MAKPTRFTPVQTDSGWRINIPAKYSPTGKRQRNYYPTKTAALEAAKGFRQDKETYGIQARAISPGLAEEAFEASRILQPLGIGLLEAVRRFADQENSRRASTSVEEAATEFTTRNEAKSRKYTQSIRHALQHLVEDFSGRQLSTISGEEMSRHIAKRTSGNAAFNAKLRVLTTFWRWAAKPPRSWCNAEALSTIERRDAVSGEIGVLTAKAAKHLMKTAELYFPECVQGFAIALFTGIRQEELLRLQPEDFSESGIEVPALSAKTKKRRYIELPEPLITWLREYPLGETVLPANWKRKEQAVRLLAGWRVWSDLVERPDDYEKRPTWPNNALRHTAASVAVATGRPLEKLLFEHGHTGGVETLRRHYVGRMPKSEAEAILRIGPHGTEILPPSEEPPTEKVDYSTGFRPIPDP